MAVEIPVKENEQSSFTQVTSLDGVDYLLKFRWNEREQRWYMGLFESDGTPIVDGVKIVSDWSLLRLTVREQRPAGEIYAHDATGEGDPRIGDLGTRVRLIYIPEAEL